MLDLEAGLREHPPPFALIKGAIVAGVAPALKGVYKARRFWIARQQVILQHQNPSRFQHPRAFAHEALGIGEVMGRDSASRQVKAVSFKGQIFRVRLLKADVVDALLLDDEAFRPLQHARREITGDDMGDMRRELQGSVPAARGDIERPPMGLRLNDCQQTVQIRAARVGLAGHVTIGEAGVTRFRQGF